MIIAENNICWFLFILKDFLIHTQVFNLMSKAFEEYEVILSSLRILFFGDLKSILFKLKFCSE